MGVQWKTFAVGPGGWTLAVDRYAITTLGCKVNQYDSAVLEAALAAEGLVHAPEGCHGCAAPVQFTAGHDTHGCFAPVAPDLVVVNTCCVTAAAMAKSRRAVARAVRAAPGAAVLVTGCYARYDPARLAAVLESLGVPVGRAIIASGNGIQVGGPKGLVRGLGGLSTSRSGGGGAMKEWMSASRPLTRAAGSLSTDIRTRRIAAVKRNQAAQRSSQLRERTSLTGLTASGLVASANQASWTASANQASCTVETSSPSPHPDLPSLPLLSRFPRHQRAFVKVQDGCDAFCAYCVVPYTRPVVQWRPLEIVLEECRRLLRAGHRELVLCGVFLGAYGRSTARQRRWGDRPSLLPELVRRVGELEGLWRLRLSSLEPGDLGDELLGAFRQTPAAAWHFHLPLQSGSPRILKRMNRQYTPAQYRHAVDRIRAACADAAITTDILAGFPGEGEDDFRLTLDLARYAGFSKIHAFPFSAIEGTAAWTYRREAPNPPVVRRRLVELAALEKQLAAAYRARFVGRTMEALVEKPARAGRPGEAMTDRYMTVFFPDAALPPGEVASFLVTGVHPDGLWSAAATPPLWVRRARRPGTCAGAFACQPKRSPRRPHSKAALPPREGCR